MFPRIPLMIALITMGVIGFLFAQSTHSNPSPRFVELSTADAARLDQQRAVIADAIKQRYGVNRLTRTRADLPLLQKLIDDHVFNNSQTYQLQCLGVVFGDVLASELPLRWVMISDEFGTDPTLRFKKSSLNINALTMISKRIENNEQVNLSQLLRTTRKYVSELEKNQIH